jgi:hypothetical protein
MILTRKDVMNKSCESTTVMKASLTLTGSSSISSVSCVSEGTVFSMRSIIVAHVSANDVGEARLSNALDQGCDAKGRDTDLFIVTFPSLENILRSEAKLTFDAGTTSGFCVVPSKYSVILPNQSNQLLVARQHETQSEAQGALT